MLAYSDNGYLICLLTDILILSGSVVAAFVSSCKIDVGGGCRLEVSQKKIKKSNDQRVPVTRYEVLFSGFHLWLNLLIIHLQPITINFSMLHDIHKT